MVPARALAATVRGLARNTLASLWPILPGKFRFVVLMQLNGVFSRPKVSLGPPRQAAQLASPIFAPADRKMSRSDLPPIFSVSSPRATSVVAGGTNVAVFPA